MNVKRILTFLALACMARASELHWQNGEWIGGHLMEVADDHVVWRSEIFAEPLKVSLSVLRRVGKLPEDRPTKEPFSIRMADGTRLYGNVVGISATTIALKSARFGTMRIERSAVTSIKRLNGAGILFAVPMSTSGWIESDVKNNKRLWRVIPGAALRQYGWNRSATLPLELPEQVEMQFNLTSTVRPEFKLDLKVSAQEKVTIETWVDDVVLQGREFQSLKTLKDTDHRVALTLFWNRKTGLCAIYNADGKKLAETSKPPVVDEKEKAADKKPAAPAGGGGLFGALLGVVQGAAQARVDAVRAQARVASSTTDNTPAGFTLLNKGPDLKLEGLRIRSWDGTLPTDITDARPCVELTDGHHLKASVVRADSAGLTVRAKDSGKETTLTWDKVLGIEMEPPSPFYSALSPGTEMWFADGEWISGLLLHMRNEVATMKTGWCKEPVSFKFGEARRLDLRENKPGPASPDLATLDTLIMGKKKPLHGTLEAGGGVQPRWRVVGGLTPATMLNAENFEITRAVAAKPEGMRSEALLYVNNGDVVPGKLRVIDDKHVDFDSDVVAVKQLPSAKIHAVQFGGDALNLDGFEDAGWRRVRGSDKVVKRNGKGALDFEPGGSWGHPTFMQTNEINFNLLSNGFSALRIRLFCDGVNPAAPSTNLLFGHMGSEVCFGLESSGDQMDRQFRMRTSGPAAVRIAIADASVEVFFNGVSARKIVIEPKMRSGSGIIIEPFSLWGNGEREVKINAFSSRIAPGRVAVPNVEAKAKEHALTVPRFRKEDPPKHALIAANGDLLRGVIEAATARHFAVRSGLETIQVPRDRVKAAVWLIKPLDEVNAAFEARAREGDPQLITHWLLLNNGGRLGLKVERFAEDAVIGQSELLGACRVPLKQINVIRSTEPPENAAMTALRDWKLKFAPEPVLPETGGESSPLLGKDAKTFKLPLLAGGDFDLAQEKGKVIVLDFWATWCGPCIKSLPGMIDEMAAFDATQVRFIGVNQAEAKDSVKTFLETRGWKLEVALDANQRVGQSFGVEGIPHTVIIGPDGKIAFVKTGYEPDGAKKITEVVRKLLEKK